MELLMNEDFDGNDRNEVKVLEIRAFSCPYGRVSRGRDALK
jgi:hypothetical protein